MPRLACVVGSALVFTVALTLPASAQPQASKPPLRRAILTGAVAGGALAAVPGAMWGHKMADGANALMGAAVLGSVGAASGATTGAINALLPAQRGWKKHALTIAVGVAVSTVSFWTIGQMNGKVGPLHPDDFRNIGIGHGAMTAMIMLKFGG